jgi:NAD(P)-dependent dehydrogenase (short-subunit alcohol dehydrogenase family)
MVFTKASIPDFFGEAAVVTEANGGLGMETAKAFAGDGAHVVMGVRD